MSPMLDIQRRWAEAGRIRLGVRTLSGRGKSIPKALDNEIRVTSQSREVVDAVARVYGGTTTEWEGGWQLIFPGDCVRITVLPGDACVGWWEQWRRGDGMPVCTRRCDGFTNVLTGDPCDCPPLDRRLADRDRYCHPTTRLWFMLPEVEVVGAFRLETHGLIAAETFPQSVMVLQQALEQGELIPALLRVVRVESSGRAFVVPRIEVVGVSLDQLLGGEPARALPPPPEPSLGSGPPALPEADSPVVHTPTPGAPTQRQMNKIRVLMRDRGITDNDEVHAACTSIVGHPVESLKELTQQEVDDIIQGGGAAGAGVASPQNEQPPG